jgi:hypothetical protein
MSKRILADPKYNPELQDTINSSTKLSTRTSIGTFLGSYGNRTNFDYIPDQATRLDIARHLYAHAEIMNTFYAIPQFNKHRLIVAESVYPQRDIEVNTGHKVNLFKAQGRTVVYQLANQEGQIANDMIFDLAVIWKDYITFEELFLDYDTYNPDGSLTSQIVLRLPEILPDFRTNNVSGIVKTYFNGKVQSVEELVEILP